VESEPGKGSSFWLTVRVGRGHPLPVAPSATDNAEARLRRNHVGARLLLVEDDPINQEIALAQLRLLAFEVDLAPDGAEAVHLAETNDYALVLMDMQMPVLDGVAASRAIRLLPGRAEVPIIAMTANAFDEDRQKCLDAGMNDFLTKPVHFDKLCALLLRWLDYDQQCRAVAATATQLPASAR
jgi:CheY-like chemotaxis protein